MGLAVEVGERVVVEQGHGSASEGVVQVGVVPQIGRRRRDQFFQRLAERGQQRLGRGPDPGALLGRHRRELRAQAGRPGRVEPFIQ